MSYQLWLADALRAEGLRVVEVDGWRTRGNATFTPRGSVNHHTAGPRAGMIPSLATLIFGRRDLPGPLCNVGLARDNTAYVVAAGRANHAGQGGWKGLAGNASVLGLEVESIGTPAEPWRPDQIDAMARVHAAFAKGAGFDASMVCQHKEWTPRKPDAHSIHGPTFRAMVAQRLQGAPAPTPAPAPAPAPAPTPPPPAVPRPVNSQEISMFLVAEGVGIFAVIDGVPVGFPDLASFGAAKAASPGVPVMTVSEAVGRPMVEILLKKLAKSLA